MFQDILILAIPIVFLIDVAILVTWVTMAFLDGYGIPKRITIRGVIIANVVVVVHPVLMAAYFYDSDGAQKFPLEKVGESMMDGPN